VADPGFDLGRGCVDFVKRGKGGHLAIGA